MRRWLRQLALIAGMLLALPLAASANGAKNSWKHKLGSEHASPPAGASQRDHGPKPKHGPRAGVPELDPSGMSAAAALLAGGLLALLDRRRPATGHVRA